MEYYLSLGANLGDRIASLQAAKGFLAGLGELLQSSSIYESTPVGMPGAPLFLNAVVSMDSRHEPRDLLKLIKQYEKNAGRDELQGHYLPRMIDIDIVMIPDTFITAPGLCLPHPEMHKRAFVLLPLLTIAPDLVHPVSGKNVRQMLDNLSSDERVEFFCPF